MLYDEATKLPYLVAVIKEGMRMFPSVGLTLPRVVPEGGITIDWKTIPAGVSVHLMWPKIRQITVYLTLLQAVVGMSAHMVHFDRRVFGPDADSFVPERWLHGKTAQMDRCFFEV